jgi:hypothetical protein
MAINTVKLEQIVQDFVTETPNVRGAAIINRDGLRLAWKLPGDMHEERVSAMSAALLSLGQRVGQELVQGLTEPICIRGQEGLSILTNCGEDEAFLVLAGQTAQRELLMLDIQRTLENIKPALS